MKPDQQSSMKGKWKEGRKIKATTVRDQSSHSPSFLGPLGKGILEEAESQGLSCCSAVIHRVGRNMSKKVFLARMNKPAGRLHKGQWPGGRANLRHILYRGISKNEFSWDSRIRVVAPQPAGQQIPTPHFPSCPHHHLSSSAPPAAVQRLLSSSILFPSPRVQQPPPHKTNSFLPSPKWMAPLRPPVAQGLYLWHFLSRVDQLFISSENSPLLGFIDDTNLLSRERDLFRGTLSEDAHICLFLQE